MAGMFKYMGHEKEAKRGHPARDGGKQPPVHSHSKKPHRKITPGKRAR